MSGKIFTSLDDPRSRLHIDPRSTTHGNDFKNARAKVADARILRRERLVEGVNRKLQHPSVGLGICFDSNFRELSFEEHQVSLKSLRDESTYYVAERADRPGRKRKRRVRGGGLKGMATTFRPDFAMALSAMEADHAGKIRPFLTEVAKVAVEEFEAMTGLKAETVSIHPEEGVLHIHISYRIVRNERHLLANGERGWQGVHRLRQGVLGTLRQVWGNVRDPLDAIWAYEELKRVTDLVCGGDPPVNFEIARAVDAAFELLSMDSNLHHFFKAAKEKWREDTARIIEIEKAEEKKALLRSQSQEIAALKDRLDHECHKREMAEQELATLKAALAKEAKVPQSPSHGGTPPPGLFDRSERGRS